VNNEATSEVSGLNYHVQTFNIMVLCSEDYIVEPQSLKFLVEHGFDFVKQYSKGLSYYRGDDKVKLSLELFSLDWNVGKIIHIMISTKSKANLFSTKSNTHVLDSALEFNFSEMIQTKITDANL